MPVRTAVKTRKRAPASRAGELDVRTIAEAALAVLDREGVDGFTMRAVANALGVTPMALYHHVSDKGALARLVVEAAGGELPFPQPTGAWREDMWAMADWTLRATLAHPAVGRLRAAHRIWTPAMLQMNERWGALWQQTGLKLSDAVRGARMSAMAIVGLVEQELSQREAPPPDKSQLAMLPNARMALTAARNRDAEFEFVIRAMIEGVYDRLRRGAAKPPARRGISDRA